MKTLFIAAAVMMLSSGAFAKGGHSGSTSGSHSSGYVNSSRHSTSGYVKSNGTYVAPSHATNPNATRADNYSTKGNVNPDTGQAGTK